MGKLTTTCFITLDNVVQDPHLWSGDYQSEDTGTLNDSVLREGRRGWCSARPPTRASRPRGRRARATRSRTSSTRCPSTSCRRTLKTADWNNSTVLSEDPFARIRELKAEQNLLTWGSPSLVQGMLGAGLVDELVLLYSPIVLGEGKRLFGEGARHDLRSPRPRGSAAGCWRCGSPPPVSPARRTRARSAATSSGASSGRKCEAPSIARPVTSGANGRQSSSGSS